ncbi:unnamed protein product [Ilex paraguariensis]|uniref:Pentatricopeptide repeat-containing protein n=1 Tax=Ilex paraguariensis TaxID=185542 RepID=A0ABC8TF21_9AQUA
MALASCGKVLLAAKKSLISRQSQCLIGYCTNSSSITTTSLIQKLIHQPISRIKATLDSEDNNNLTFKSSEFPWDALVTALKSSSPQKAQLVVEWRLEKFRKENEGNHDCYSELISICGKMQNVPLALRVFTSMEAQGLTPTSSVFNALISACLSSGNLITALSLFEIMESSENYKPNSDTYNAFILAYANLGNDKSMLAWYSAKMAAGFSADLQTYEFLISSCIKLKHYADADKFYEEMMSAGIIPNVSILKSMLVGLCERRNLGDVKEMLKVIVDCGWEIDLAMVEKLVKLYYEVGTVEEMEDLLLTLTNSNKVREVLSRVHSAIIRMYAVSDRLDAVEYAVGRMLKQGMLFRCPDDVEKVICSYFRRKAHDRLDLFLECIKVSHKLTRSTYDLLVAGYRRAGLSEKLDWVMIDMKLAGFL